METEIVRIRDVVKQQREIARAAGILRQGQLVAFPTETVYGIGALGLDRNAVEALYAAKNRPASKAFSLQVADAGMVPRVAAYVPKTARLLMERFCPGAITVVLPKAAAVSYEVTGGRDTVGVRIPAHPVALALLRAVGQPLAVPSANISGHTSPLSASDVYADMAGRLPLILDGGTCPVGVESTIVDCTGSKIKILRHGAIGEDAIWAAIHEA
ncbi:L-threonylcarbamoyladenylate synthase [Anaerovibrio sp.]|uniref:L-threonylcarbamoyladenylate synthase n=1 Tax=Anaerovibrio sp. TaxID=1872532 RepID=UPI003F16E287